MTKIEIETNWRQNGWNGDPDNTGRDLTWICGHTYYVGWGISNNEFSKQNCWNCANPNLNDNQDE